MTSLPSIALSGMNAAQTTLGAAANNVANALTDGYHRQTVVQSPLPAGGVGTAIATAPEAGARLEADMVGMLQAKNAFLANLATFKAADQAMGSLLDIAG